MTAIYAVSDVHGHPEALRTTLTDAGLTDNEGRWAGADARLWFLGDYLDRGPDGIGVLALIRDLVEHSDGAVQALLGNHEVLALGMWHFGDRPIGGEQGNLLERTLTRAPSFERTWRRNGGSATDQARLAPYVEWLRALPFVGLDGEHLLMHSDTIGYLDWGDSVARINDTGRALLASDDLGVWWEVWRRLTDRYAFRGPAGAAVAAGLLDTLGGRTVIHGHSVIADLFREPLEQTTGPRSYAHGRALAIDGGLFDGGPCLLARLA